MRKTLSLADDHAWQFLPQDRSAEQICAALADVLQLCSSATTGRPVDVHADGGPDVYERRDLQRWPIVSSHMQNLTVWLPRPVPEDLTLLWQLTLLAQVICLEVQASGGVLLHGALIEREGRGIILAGPGGIGKSTACQRLPSPWRVWSDDLTLIIPTSQGNYAAHPWPTWSRLCFDEQRVSWDVQHAIPLHAICFLRPAQQDRLARRGAGESLCLLVECAEQALWELSWQKDSAELHRLRVQRFENLCRVAPHIPVYLLHLSLNGAFWRELEMIFSYRML